MNSVLKRMVAINCAGGVGKTTVVAHFLHPRMPGADLYSLETINESVSNFNIENTSMRGDEFSRLYSLMLTSESAIVDVGASNVEGFLSRMTGFDDGHDEFDYFIIPTTSKSKDTKDTLKTIALLNGIGVPAEKIKIIFNMVKNSVEEEFSDLLGFLKDTKKYQCDYSTKAAIWSHEAFDELSLRRLTLTDVLADKSDYKSEVRKLDSSAKNYQREHARLSGLVVLQKTARNVNRNLDDLWGVLFPDIEAAVA